MSREALSLEISQIVARVVSGESIDAVERGTLLAQKYPELGMTGDMIGQAIERAAGMVGMIKTAPEPAAWPKRRADAQATTEANGAETPVPASTERIDDALAAAIEAEIGGVISDSVSATATGSAPESPEPPRTAKTSKSETPRRGAVAALRRAFFRH
jgi:hypothetical protein